MIVDTGYPTPVRVASMALTFTPSTVNLTELAATWRGADLGAVGEFDNVVPYTLGTDALSGRLVLTSNVLDLRPFQGTSTDEAPDEAEGAVVVVPDDLDLEIRAQFGEVITSDFRMRDMRGTLSVADQTMAIEDLTASMLGGRVAIAGSYTARSPDRADIDFRIETISLDVLQTVGEFETLGRIAPVLKGVTGAFDSNFALSTRLDEAGNPDLSALASSGTVSAQGLTFTPTTLNAAASKLNRPNLQTLRLAERSLRFDIAEGKLQFQPFSATLGGLPAKVSGGAGIVDRTLDLAFDVGVPGASLMATPLLQGLSGVPATVDVRLGVLGTYDDPRLDVSLVDGEKLGQAIGEELADKLRESTGTDRNALIARATEQGDRLVAAARQRADSVRSNAATQADRLRREGDRAADKLVRDAGSNPIKKAAARTAAEAARKQADKAADRVVAEADKRADQLVAEAREQRDELIRKAEGTP